MRKCAYYLLPLFTQLLSLYHSGLPAKGWYHPQWAGPSHTNPHQTGWRQTSGTIPQLRFPLPIGFKLVSNWKQTNKIIGTLIVWANIVSSGAALCRTGDLICFSHVLEFWYLTEVMWQWLAWVTFIVQSFQNVLFFLSAPAALGRLPPFCSQRVGV